MFIYIIIIYIICICGRNYINGITTRSYGSIHNHWYYQ